MNHMAVFAITGLVGIPLGGTFVTMALARSLELKTREIYLFIFGIALIALATASLSALFVLSHVTK